MKTLTYKNFIGSAEVDVEVGICFGKILFINDVINYQSDTPKELQQEFEDAVEDYIETCREINKDPEKSFTGQFNVRIPQEHHRQIAIFAAQKDSSLNSIIAEAVSHYIDLKILSTRKIEHFHKVEIIVKKQSILVAGASDVPNWHKLDEKMTMENNHVH